jgi:K+-transporting ATPase KdpF subunit
MIAGFIRIYPYKRNIMSWENAIGVVIALLLLGYLAYALLWPERF